MVIEFLAGWRKANPVPMHNAFELVKARPLLECLEIHYTPKHGSWLNIAGIELNVLTKQCLGHRILDIGTLRSEAKVGENRRNAVQRGINWQFTTDDARIKLKHLYPES
uniref:DDE superfamily endonuclease n=1 Tax=Candidatus Kentrum eta TaxID=2126337 RepID=A0A450UKC2_9GAMM|nr:MAG: hypothetical protein BECKH772A_GA0070896_100394 [Candidatus Kentron sp. H]VFJ92999.1 MAG: hypothetical protein BECKH772B_GA0070898_100374 [Candidatus Kentron sp. H]VFJ99853.1 MAG: hypothetical protein BECKH772C_GA0070978_100364 [Candidatus Kentron sp. H]